MRVCYGGNSGWAGASAQLGHQRPIADRTSLNEIDAVSGGACVTQANRYMIGNKGMLEVGFTECDGVPGVKIPYAKWTPTNPGK